MRGLAANDGALYFPGIRLNFESPVGEVGGGRRSERWGGARSTAVARREENIDDHVPCAPGQSGATVFQLNSHARFTPFQQQLHAARTSHTTLVLVPNALQEVITCDVAEISSSPARIRLRGNFLTHH